MTVSLSTWDVANQIKEQFPDAVSEINDQAILVKSESLFEVAQYLKNRPELDFDYLNYISAVDYFDYFELVYQLTSINHNHSLILKTRCYGRDNPTLPSLVSLWRGADFQEREIYDLMGIRFDGHPNMKRIFLWDGFQGHPLRKDYL
ncbi:MAG: NADH-quinone oxidoreductase subunit C [Dehalococcoidales bacterium]|nr:NADH-quinone oxidoreductase subunit C [Dehalococcoidales bacterium]